ncbi:MAG TPA: YqgE/AlgH family protein, partial [Terriglobia bacterium]
MMRTLKAPLAFAAAAALWATAFAAGQSRNPEDLGVGKLLVSSRDIGDPSFAHSVILLTQYDQHGAVGLMINRRTQAAISRVLKDVDTAKRGSDPVYIGGPVELDAVLALLRSKKKPDEATSVLDEVYLASTKPALEKALAASLGSSDLRVYLGYCGWGGGQLENEVR